MTMVVEQLLERAAAKAGLSDFGDPAFLPPLERLVEALNTEAKPSAFGQKAIPKVIGSYLTTRLQVESWYARHPEIDDQQIVAPVFGVGLPRTGSTALGHMLAQDRNTRTLRGWEAWNPCPPPDAATEDTDPRIAAAEANNPLDNAVPELREMLPRDPRGPEECIALLYLSFMPAFSFEVWGRLPAYCEWGDTAADATLVAYRYHERVLKLLQWRCPPRRWFLRTPYHTAALDPILEVYPDARFVWSHRKPVPSLTSISSLVYHLCNPYVADPEPERLGEIQLRHWGVALDRGLAVRDRTGEDRHFDVSHHRQLADPAEQIRALYHWLGWEYDEALGAKILRWQEANPRGDHRATADFFGLDEAEVASRFAGYAERFAPYL